MIICGYAGIGKSYLGHHIPGVIDLESTPFEKDWDRYVKCAKHYSRQGYLVLVSCHRELRERLCDPINGAYPGDRITIVPAMEDKELYRERYTKRGNTEAFIELQMNNWEKWLNEKDNRILNEHWEVMEPGETLYDTLVRLSKKSPGYFCSYDNCPVGTSCDNPECVNPFKPFVS
jgi:hypothetical protein